MVDDGHLSWVYKRVLPRIVRSLTAICDYNPAVLHMRVPQSQDDLSSHLVLNRGSGLKHSFHYHTSSPLAFPLLCDDTFGLPKYWSAPLWFRHYEDALEWRPWQSVQIATYSRFLVWGSHVPLWMWPRDRRLYDVLCDGGLCRDGRMNVCGDGASGPHTLKVHDPLIPVCRPPFCWEWDFMWTVSLSQGISTAPFDHRWKRFDLTIDVSRFNEAQSVSFWNPHPLAAPQILQGGPSHCSSFCGLLCSIWKTPSRLIRFTPGPRYSPPL